MGWKVLTLVGCLVAIQLVSYSCDTFNILKCLLPKIIFLSFLSNPAKSVVSSAPPCVQHTASILHSVSPAAEKVDWFYINESLEFHCQPKINEDPKKQKSSSKTGIPWRILLCILIIQTSTITTYKEFSPRNLDIVPPLQKKAFSGGTAICRSLYTYTNCS